MAHGRPGAPRGPRPKSAFDLRLGVPAASDPCWEIQSRPLLDYLKQRRSETIDHIVAWGVAQGLGGTGVRQLLAWLSFTDRAHYDAEEGLWRAGAGPRVVIPAVVEDVPEVTKLVIPWPRDVG